MTDNDTKGTSTVKVEILSILVSIDKKQRVRLGFRRHHQYKSHILTRERIKHHTIFITEKVQSLKKIIPKSIQLVSGKASRSCSGPVCFLLRPNRSPMLGGARLSGPPRQLLAHSAQTTQVAPPPPPSAGKHKPHIQLAGKIRKNSSLPLQVALQLALKGWRGAHCAAVVRPF